MKLHIRKAVKSDLDRCVEIRGLTRDNPISKELLVSIGVTTESWDPKLDNGTYEGLVAEDNGVVVGYTFADTKSGEVLVLAILPPYEGAGLGKKLLNSLVERLFSLGHSKLWLAASPDPQIRAHGFYRRLGWQPTQTFDQNGDEILNFKKL